VVFLAGVLHYAHYEKNFDFYFKERTNQNLRINIVEDDLQLAIFFQPQSFAALLIEHLLNTVF
jgi:hypothetical protein